MNLFRYYLWTWKKLVAIVEDKENTLLVLNEIVENSPYQLDEMRYRFLADSAAQMLMINSCWNDTDFKYMRLSAKGMALLDAMEREQEYYFTVLSDVVENEGRKEAQSVGAK